jgi:hypothetical protein
MHHCRCFTFKAYRGRAASLGGDADGCAEEDGEWSLTDSTNPVCQAANNIELAEAIYNVTMQQGVGLSRHQKQKLSQAKSKAKNSASKKEARIPERNQLFRNSASTGVLQFSGSSQSAFLCVFFVSDAIVRVAIAAFYRICPLCG